MDTWELGQADFDILSDRASETLDPMTSLRSDVLYVFLESWVGFVTLPGGVLTTSMESS